MAARHYGFVIIGGGIAGVSCAETVSSTSQVSTLIVCPKVQFTT